MLKRLWSHLSKRRQKQFILLQLFVIIASFFEMISLGAVIPFLTVLADPEPVFANELMQPFIQFLEISTGSCCKTVVYEFVLAALITLCQARVAHERVRRAAGFPMHPLSSLALRDHRSGGSRRRRGRGGPGAFFTLVKKSKSKEHPWVQNRSSSPCSSPAPRAWRRWQATSLALRCVCGCGLGVLVAKQQACRAEHAPRTGCG